MLNTSSGSAGIVVTANRAPRPGIFTISPAEGVARGDDFTFSALQWQDSDLPLNYEFGYRAVSTSKRVTMSSRSAFTSAKSQLPVRAESKGYEMSCFALIYDRLNANATSTRTIVVNLALALSVVEIQEYANEAPESSNPDDLKQYSALSSSLLNEVNCSLAPNCSELYRQECSSTAHTCGDCEYEDFISLGNNQPCVSFSSILTSSGDSTGGGTNATTNTKNTCTSSDECEFFEVCKFSKNTTDIPGTCAL